MLNILLVEDDELIIDIVKTLLEKELKAFVICLTSGNEAIKLLQHNLQFDVIVSDYSMKNGTGHDLLEFITVNEIKIPFILFTNTINPKLPQFGENFRGIVEKLQIEKLYEIIIREISTKA